MGQFRDDGSGVPPWTAHVLTVFPEMFPGPLGHSLARKGAAQGRWSLQIVDIRDHARDNHRSVDGPVFGGGAGLVMRADVIDAALSAVRQSGLPAAEQRPIYLSPRGTPITQARIRALADGPGAVLLCGRYEGVDARVLQAWDAEEISVGDIVLSGGEPAALCVLDACVRLLPGVIANAAGPVEESFEDGLLEYPHYTRPRDWGGVAVPEILVGGDHGRIERWRQARAVAATRRRRPDLWWQHIDDRALAVARGDVASSRPEGGPVKGRRTSDEPD